MGVIIMEEVIQIIQSLGFPVACVIALFWQNNHLNEQHREEMNAITDALENNTQALIRLEEKIGGLKQ